MSICVSLCTSLPFRFEQCYADEDLMPHVGRIAGACHARTMGRHSLPLQSVAAAH